MSRKDVSVAALMIGRGGSSLKDKNILPVLGFPLLQWAASAAVRSHYVDRYYVSSDDEKILDAAAQVGYEKIRRPDELATDTAQSCDAVRHAMEVISRDGRVDLLVVQHANVGTISEQIIDACVDEMLADETLTAVVPSHQQNEYHPMRAKRLTEEGVLAPFVPLDPYVSANRQDLPVCYFFDHSIWVLRTDTIDDPRGQAPWTCMGQKIKPFPTQGCLDVHTVDDLKTTEDWIISKKIPYPRVKDQSN